jgi:hypothetical protein
LKSLIVVVGFGGCEAKFGHDSGGAKGFREGNEDVEIKG